MSRTLAQDKLLRHTLLLVGVLAGLVLGISGGAWAQNYTFTTINVPGSFSTVIWGINSASEIVGFFGDATGGHGFLASGGSFTTIDVPGSTVTTDARGINNVGQFVGYFRDIRGFDHGFLASGGSYTPIQVKARQNILYTSAEINRPDSVPPLPPEEPLG
jgi:probable HAF family extracellular repeat protein